MTLDFLAYCSKKKTQASYKMSKYCKVDEMLLALFIYRLLTLHMVVKNSYLKQLIVTNQLHWQHFCWRMWIPENPTKYLIALFIQYIQWHLFFCCVSKLFDKIYWLSFFFALRIIANFFLVIIFIININEKSIQI